MGHEIEEWLDKQETCCMMRWRVVSIIQLDRSMLYILNNSLADLLYIIYIYIYIYMCYKYIYYIAGLHRQDNSQGGRLP